MMAVEKKTLVCVDSNQADAEHLQLALSDSYQVEVFCTGAECLNRLKTVEAAPDLVLLEVNLDDGEGFEVCKQIRESKDFYDIPVLFVTNQSSLQDKLKGYEVGGDDYICKPCDINLVKAKIVTNLNRYLGSHCLRSALADVTDTAINALIMNNELDMMVDFTHDCLEMNTYAQLAQRLFQVLAHYHLEGSIQVRSQYGARNYSMTGIVQPLEAEIFRLSHDHPSIAHFNNKSVFVRNHITLLVKNMSVENQDLYNRLVDHLSIIVNYANARVQAIDIEESKNLQLQHISNHVAQNIKSDIQQLEQQFKRFEEDSCQVMKTLNQELDDMLFSLALNDTQEAQLQQLVRDAHANLEKILDQEVELDQYIDTISQHINELLDQDKQNAAL